MTNNEINQTALQEFWGKISLKLSFEQIDEFVPLFYQAKEMEKERMIDFAFNALKIADNTRNRYVDVDKLYKELYGGGEQ